MIIEPENKEELIQGIGKSPLLIYGMGYVGGLIAEWCEQNQIKYVYVDRMAEEKGTNTCVILPEQLMRSYLESMVVIASINYYDEIYAVLKQMGVEKERIISCMRFWPKMVRWEELEETVDWEKVKQRAKRFARWISPMTNTVADYGYEKNVLREFLPSDMRYEAPNYIRIKGNALVADFEQEGAVIYSEVSFGMAILMSFLNPEDVIEHLCSQTKEAIIISYVPFENLSAIPLRRSINYHNDYTEEELIQNFLSRGFELKEKEQDSFDEVNIIYLFERKR